MSSTNGSDCRGGNSVDRTETLLVVDMEPLWANPIGSARPMSHIVEQAVPRLDRSLRQFSAGAGRGCSTLHRSAVRCRGPPRQADAAVWAPDRPRRPVRDKGVLDVVVVVVEPPKPSSRLETVCGTGPERAGRRSRLLRRQRIGQRDRRPGTAPPRSRTARRTPAATSTATSRRRTARAGTPAVPDLSPLSGRGPIAVGRHLGTDPRRHERGHAGTAEHGTHLAGRVVHAGTGAGQLRRQVARRGGGQRRPDERHRRHPARRTAAPVPRSAWPGSSRTTARSARSPAPRSRSRRTGRGWTRSTILPTNGASTPLVIAIGAVSRAERVGDNPHTAWA